MDDTSLRPRPGETAEETVDRVVAAVQDKVRRSEGYEITLTVSRVKDENARWVASVLHHLEGLFRLDGTDVSTQVSATFGGDRRVERIYELLGEEMES